MIGSSPMSPWAVEIEGLTGETDGLLELELHGVGTNSYSLLALSSSE